jgi:mRNA-degrading endonuclease RelE of RelBE toxin-antitoxin system
MKYDVITISQFRREAKKLIKKYPSLNEELVELTKILEDEPKSGIPLGNNCYKIRIAISSKGKGKSGGARVITTVFIDEKTVYLLSIFDKSKQVTISDKKLKELLQNLK